MEVVYAALVEVELCLLLQVQGAPVCCPAVVLEYHAEEVVVPVRVWRQMPHPHETQFPGSEAEGCV